MKTPTLDKMTTQPNRRSFSPKGSSHCDRSQIAVRCTRRPALTISPRDKRMPYDSVAGKPPLQSTRRHENRAKISDQNECPAEKNIFSENTKPANRPATAGNNFNRNCSAGLIAKAPILITARSGVRQPANPVPQLLRQIDKAGSTEDCQISGDPAAHAVVYRSSTGNR